ncbi:MAG TPA: acetyl-CoA carboxylase biotin carboxyl carrier protein [Planctomycetaceae bacterium]|jgi:acetyl-CoA carboxylase biotin carboxyl carrier protein|nr:acetyl-CoA carboxylase biotin carboxyl carrier protein [Planctomycetaceae bacterium]HCK54362.1 acetyl-CoA carboxylase biotin carboxyl carrier protein [Planctomycetaceae bacterium]|tara:strand:+ start:216 stop:677 length:462 start_codon:yes stop_codon:yes gene_type:complete
MADDQAFDLEKIRELVALMDEHGLSEISLSQGDRSWKLRRGPTEGATVVSPVAASQAPPVEPDGGSGDQSAEPQLPTINAPTVGTFYSAASPEDPPFVKVGQAVTPESIVCIVEAMKVFNQIPAETSGTIVEVLVENGEAVEFGQPLFRIQPA